ncbi:MAG: acyl-CoA thioesterase [Terriglobales bacterium]
MQSSFFETVHQTIYPGDCDVMGHLNTRHYTALFDHAQWELLRQLGVDDAFGAGATMGWADVETVVRYRREVAVGAHVRVRSRLVRAGRTSLVTEHVLVVDTDDVERASSQTTSVRLDLNARRAAELPECLHTYREK